MTFHAMRPFNSVSNLSNLSLDPDEVFKGFFKFYYSHNAVSSYGTTQLQNIRIENDAYEKYLDDTAQQEYDEEQAELQRIREEELDKIRQQAIADFEAMSEANINHISKGDDVCN